MPPSPEQWVGPVFWYIAIGLGLAIPIVLEFAALARGLAVLHARIAPWLILAGGLAARQAIVFGGQM
jgi:formate-dependent nitrite reductase membrane component NrfD